MPQCLNSVVRSAANEVLDSENTRKISSDNRVAGFCPSSKQLSFFNGWFYAFENNQGVR